MAQSVFFSFDYDQDNWRVQKVQNMGRISGGVAFEPQDWEQVRRSTDAAVERWIDEQMKHTRAVIVLIGEYTHDSRWVRHEIIKAWNENRPLVGIDIHGLTNAAGYTSRKGANPFDIELTGGALMSSYVPRFTPTGLSSQSVYNDIRENIEDWVARGYRRS